MELLSMRYTDFSVVEASKMHVVEFHKGYLRVCPPEMPLAKWTLQRQGAAGSRDGAVGSPGLPLGFAGEDRSSEQLAASIRLTLSAPPSDDTHKELLLSSVTRCLVHWPRGLGVNVRGRESRTQTATTRWVQLGLAEVPWAGVKPAPTVTKETAAQCAALHVRVRRRSHTSKT